MLKSCFILVVGLLLLSPVVMSQEDYENHSLLYVKPIPTDELPGFLRGGWDIVEITPDGGFKIVATPSERVELMTVYQAIVEIENLEEYYRKRLDPTKDMGGYHTLDEVSFELLTASFYPMARLDTIGYSIWNLPIEALKISDNVDIDEDEPEILINAATHAREVITPQVVFHFMHYLLDNYGVDPEVTALVDS